MNELGTTLREARVRRGATIEDVAARTKLPKQTVDDIEHDRLDRLPRGLLGRSHLRTYARFLGLDAELVVSIYMRRRFGESGEVLPMDRPAPVEADTRRLRLLVVEIGAVVLAIAISSALFSGGPSRRVATVSSAQLPATLAAEDPVTMDATVNRADEAGLRIEMVPNGPCWVLATADDKIVIQRLLDQGDRVVAVAIDELELRVGDPGTFSYRINGRPGRQLGEPGAPVTVQITRENYETFQASPAPDGPAPPEAKSI